MMNEKLTISEQINVATFLGKLKQAIVDEIIVSKAHLLAALDKKLGDTAVEDSTFTSIALDIYQHSDEYTYVDHLNYHMQKALEFN